MEAIAGTGPRSAPEIPEPDVTGLDSLQFNEEIHHLIMSVPNENASSFTALLELPPTRAMELLHSPESSPSPATIAGVKPKVNENNNNNNNNNNEDDDDDNNKTYFSLPSNSALIERAARYSIFATNSPETSSVPSNSSANLEKVKREPTETETASDPTVENNRTTTSQRSAKRKEREKKVKTSTKKSKSTVYEDAEKLPYVHVRARRGEATDSHSLAERARREKINARMKLLQELVPGCNKISGTALVLDEIISHVQSLQRQVEFLSMRLAAVNPRSDFNLDSILAAESGSLMDSNFPSMVMPLMWPEVQVNGNRQQYQQQRWHFDALHQPVWGREEDSHNFFTPENSLLSYDSSANSASLHSNHQMNMEL